jgi:hypothetical protein
MNEKDDDFIVARRRRSSTCRDVRLADLELNYCLFSVHLLLLLCSRTALLTVLNAGFKLTPGARSTREGSDLMNVPPTRQSDRTISVHSMHTIYVH